MELGLPRFHLVKHWTLVGLNCYLFFSLNFVGIFAQESPARLTSRGHHQQNFRASPYESPYSESLEDTIDLSQIPPVPHKLVENSIDRFDAYGDYEYIDVDQHPKPIQYHKPLRHRPAGPGPYFQQEPQRRVDFNRVQAPYHGQFQPSQQYYSQYRPVQQYVRPPPPRKGGFFSSLFNFNDRNDNTYPSSSSSEYIESEDTLLDPLLKLIGLKSNQVSTAENQDPYSQFHDPLEYDYGDYLEGYQNYVKPQRPKTIPERIAKWFNGFKIPSGKPKKPTSFERVHQQEAGQSLDYSQYETGEDENLIFYNNRPTFGSSGQASVAGLYDFGDVVQAIRNNETTGEVIKKFLSAAAALSERSDSNPVFMMWTIPTTILALMGLVYFVGALAIIGYKYMLDGNGDPSTLLTVGAVFAIPLVLGFILVASRSAVSGELAVNRLVRGDVRGSMRQDFDGVDFVMDAIFGSSALLGIGWLVSITV